MTRSHSSGASQDAIADVERLPVGIIQRLRRLRTGVGLGAATAHQYLIGEANALR